MHIKITWVLFFLLLLSGCMSTGKRYALADRYYQEQRYTMTVKTLLPLARKGEARAQYQLGYLYYNGQGVVADRSLAKWWIAYAAMQGYAPAKEALQRIESHEKGVT